MGENEERSDSITCIISVLREQEKRDLTDIKHQKVSEGIRASLFEGLGLAEYVMAKNCDRTVIVIITTANGAVRKW